MTSRSKTVEEEKPADAADVTPVKPAPKAKAADLLASAAAELRTRAEQAGSDGAPLAYIAERVAWCEAQLRNLENA